MENRKIKPFASGVIHGNNKHKMQDDEVINMVNNHSDSKKVKEIKQAY